MVINIVKVQKVLVVVSFAIAIVVNALANILPFNGKTTAMVSAQYPVYFTPANYVFGIWGLIYVALLGYVVYQFVSKAKDQQLFVKISWKFIAVSILNALWMFAWHYDQIGLTVLLMVGILVLLIKIYQEIKANTLATRKFTLLVQFPFSIYLGWISVATIANISAFLYAIGWNGFGISEVVWCACMLIIAGALGMIYISKFHDTVFAAVIVWAAVGIAARFSSVDAIVAIVLVVSAALAASIVLELIKRRIFRY
jgi:hypothetical protein